ncbi:hypothetical protein [Glaciimonas soli]|uniref:Uncharacterized protein n=1 Tax=Glaciimonas soli TaxID=2590999 RepID=A0A843YRF6_9BURK|nr:hypothetical protein [Glaciimonas soli]MQR00083.1 hypothetical protein [Glaciimonas soli]
MTRDIHTFEIFFDNVRRFVRDKPFLKEAETERPDNVPTVLVQDIRECDLFGWSSAKVYDSAELIIEELAMAAFEILRCAVAFLQASSSPPSGRNSSRVQRT